MVMKFNQAIDTVHAGPIVTDAEHHEVHVSKAFISPVFYSSVGSGASVVVSIQTPDTTRVIHMKFLVSAGLSGVGYLRESVTFTGTSTAVTSVCLNRNNASTGSLVVSHTATLLNTGTVIGYAVVGGGDHPLTSVGGVARANFEYNLKRNTLYAIQFTSDTNNKNVLINSEWYEAG